LLQVVLQKLLGSHRLCLLLDLDHTLVSMADM
jgi:predicted HAD superfamily phosphohydrolase YqeG